MNNGIKNLSELHKTAKAGKFGDFSIYVAESLEAFFSLRAKTLDEAFGVDGKSVGCNDHGRGWRTELIHQERNKHLLCALRIIAAGDKLKSSHCYSLAKEVDSFKANILPRIGRFDNPPENYSDLIRHLFYANKTLVIPATYIGLKDAINKELPEGSKI